MKNMVINGADNKPIAIDIHLCNTTNKAPLVIYAHGFNGFKDWGNGNEMAAWFNAQGVHFLKFNFSHNGTAPEKPLEFTELAHFGNNNFSKQLYDLTNVIDWIHHPLHPLSSSIDYDKISLIGHSMGGGIAILHAAQDKRISKLVTWAAIAEATTPWGKWNEDKMAAWKESGVAYYHNARTQQDLPLYYQLKEDYDQHHERLNIKQAAQSIQIPWLICHAEDDAAVNIAIAHQLKSYQKLANVWIGSGGHTFGRKHPQAMPFDQATIDLWQASIQFILQPS